MYVSAKVLPIRTSSDALMPVRAISLMCRASSVCQRNAAAANAWLAISYKADWLSATEPAFSIPPISPWPNGQMLLRSLLILN